MTTREAMRTTDDPARETTPRVLSPIKQAILAEIERAGWQRAELARRAGMTPPALSRYLNSDRPIRSDVLERLLAALGLAVAQSSSGA